MGDSDTPTPQLDPELLEYLNGPPPQDANGIDLSTIRVNLTMSLEARAEAHHQAMKLADEFRKLGEARYGRVRRDPSQAD